MKQQLPKSVLLAALPVVLVVTSCHHHSSNSGNNNNGPVTLYEIEPNGNSVNPDFIGTVVPGDSLNIEGRITNDGSDDFDGFGFVALQPLVVEFRLYADNPAADLDLRVYDPEFDDFPASFTSVFDPEEGAFSILTAGQEFHMVVDSAFGTSTYFLEVDFFAPGPALNPATDGDQPVSDVVLLRARPSRLNSPDLSRSSYLRRNAVEPTSGPSDFSVERSVQITIDERGRVTTRAGLLVRPRADQADRRDPGDPDER
jgi:hypothetical protein